MQIIEQDDKDDEYERNEAFSYLMTTKKKNLKEAEQKTRLKKKLKLDPRRRDASGCSFMGNNQMSLNSWIPCLFSAGFSM